VELRSLRVQLGSILKGLPQSSPHFRLTRQFHLDLEIALSDVLATSSAATYSAAPKMRWKYRAT